MSTHWRSRSRTLIWLVLLVALGLGSRSTGMPVFMILYAGDVLWGAFFFALGAFLWPGPSPVRLWAGAIVVTELIEASQAWRAPVLIALRATPLGGLLLGHEFLWSDVVGVALGATVALAIDARGTPVWRAMRERAAAPIPMHVSLWLGVNFLAVGLVAYGCYLFRPPPGLGPGDTYYGGPGDGLMMAFFIVLPFWGCQFCNVVGLVGMAYSLAKRRGFWSVVIAVAIVALWAMLFLYVGSGGPGPTRFAG